MPVFLVVHVCRTVDRVVGHPRSFLSSIGARGCPRPDPPMCLDAQGENTYMNYTTKVFSFYVF